MGIGMFLFCSSLFAALLDPTPIRHGVVVYSQIKSVKLLAMYVSSAWTQWSLFADMHGMLPATLPDIESDIYALLFQKKNRVSSSKLSNLQFMFVVSSVPWCSY